MLEAERKTSSEYKASMDTLKKQIDALQKQISDLNTLLQTKENNIKDLTQQVKTLQEIQDVMKKESESLKQSLSNEIKKGDVIVKDSFNSITVLLMEKVMFGKAQISITKTGEQVLKNIAETLKKIKDKEVLL